MARLSQTNLGSLAAVNRRKGTFAIKYRAYTTLGLQRLVIVLRNGAIAFGWYSRFPLCPALRCWVRTIVASILCNHTFKAQPFYPALAHQGSIVLAAGF